MTALASPRTVMMGFHPAPQLSLAEYKEVDDFLTYTDPHLASHDLRSRRVHDAQRCDARIPVSVTDIGCNSSPSVLECRAR